MNEESTQERQARQRYAAALSRAQDEIRKSEEEWESWLKAARANGNAKQVEPFALSASREFDREAGRTLKRIT